jgi:hypothetical protein
MKNISILVMALLLMQSCIKKDTPSSAAGLAPNYSKTITLKSGDPRSANLVFGVNHVAAARAQEVTPEATALAASIGFEMIRYPGGTVASYWDWKKGMLIGSENWQTGKIKDHKRFSKSKDLIAHPPKVFKSFANSLQVPKTIICLNNLTSTLAEQMQFLENIQQAGLGTDYVELGNEMYLGHSDYRKVYPNGLVYINAMQNWAKTIKGKYPNTKIALLGSLDKPGGENSNARRVGWNNSMQSADKAFFDAVTVHTYFPLDQITDPNTDVPKAFMNTYEQWRTWKSVIDQEITPWGKPIWITETNMSGKQEEDTETLHSTWLHALHLANILNFYLEQQNVEMVLVHQLFGAPMFACVQFQDSKPKMAVSGHISQIFAQALANAKTITPLKSDTEFKFENAAPKYYAWSIVNQKGEEHIILLNLSNESVEVAVPTNKSLKYGYKQSSSAQLTNKIDASQITVEEGSVENGKLYMKPYSITLMKGTK